MRNQSSLSLLMTVGCRFADLAPLNANLEKTAGSTQDYLIGNQLRLLVLWLVAHLIHKSAIRLVTGLILMVCDRFWLKEPVARN